MKTVSKYINSLLIFVSTLWLAGCADDSSILAPDIAQDGTGDVILSLNVSISNSQSGTRAEADFEPTNNPLEKIHSLRVIIVNEKDTVEHNLRVDMPDDMGVDKVGELEFKVSTKYGTTTITEKNQMIQTEKKRIYLIANEDAIPSGNDKPTDMVDIRKFLDEDLKPGANFLQSSAKYIVIWNNWQGVSGNAPTLPEYATPFINNEDDNKKYVLMSEFFDVDVTSNLSIPGEQRTKANLFVTRNLVKFRFSIKADEGTPSFKVKKIIFSNLMQKEYLFPNDTKYEPAKYDVDGKVSISNREIISYETPSLSYRDGNYVRPYIFEPENFGYNATSASQENVFAVDYEPNLYFCETRNYVKNTDGSETDSQLYTVAIEVEYQNKIKDEHGNETIDPFTVTFDAKQLENLLMLPRNTIVQVDMNVHLGVLEATATVYPYTGVWLNPEFGFSRPETDRLTVASTMDLVLNGEDGLLYPSFTSSAGNTIQNLYWVSSNPAIILLGNEVTDIGDQRYVEPSGSIELPYLQMVNDKAEPVPVRIIPKGVDDETGVGEAYVTAYTQSGLVARCKVTVKE